MHWPSLVLSIVGLVVLILGIVLGWAVFPPLVDKKIEESVVLTKDSEQYERWEKLPFPMKFKVYIFNVENPEEVTNGMKPNLTEKGPYIYNQYRQKYNIEGDDEELSYLQNQTYEFDAKGSYPLREDDIITIIHLPLVAVTLIVEQDDEKYVGIIGPQLPKIFKTDLPFLKTTVKEILFDGVKFCTDQPNKLIKSICEKITENKTDNIQVESDGSLSLAMFRHKNYNNDGLYEIKTGKSDAKDVGKIIEWNRKSTLSIWGDNDSVCNMISGTDASIYPPFLSKTIDLNIFNTDICRSVTVEYSGDITYQGINGYLFTANDKFLEESSENGTMCFCANKTLGITQPNGCLKKGVMELYPCLKAHLVLSHPHFMYADEEYQNGVEGLNPDPNIHQITVELEPNTGTPLRGGKRVQFNIFLRKIKSVPMLAKVNTTLVPIMWVDEGIELPNDMVDLLNESLFNVLVILDAVKWTLVAVGAALLVGGIIWFVIVKRKQSLV